MQATLAAAESLLEHGRVDEAVTLLERGLARFANHAEYRELLATTYGQIGRYHEAAVQARAALDLDAQPAHHLLAALAYMSAGYYTLAYRERQAWERFGLRDLPFADDLRRLDDEYVHGQKALAAEYRLKDVQTAEEAGYFLDLGRWALSDGQWADAERFSREAARLIPGWAPPRNNASLALYFLGRPKEAIAEAQRVLAECDAENVQALSNLVRFHLAEGEEPEARACGERLAALPIPKDPETVVKLVEGLSLLDRDEDIDRITGQAMRRSGGAPASLHLYRGIAAANMGRRAEALRQLRTGQEAGLHGPLLSETVQAIEQGKRGLGIAQRFYYTNYSDWADHKAIDQLLANLRYDDERGGRDDRRWAELLERYPQLPLVLRKMLYEGFPGSQAKGIDAVLNILARIGTPACIEILRSFAQGREGEQNDRLTALRLLQEAGALAKGAEVELWWDGEQRQVQTYLEEISDDFVPDYPAAAWEAYNEGVDAHREGRWADAEAAYRRMLALAPEAKEAYNNLGALFLRRGEIALGDEYLDRALEIDPLYPFPRTTRALRALNEGDISRAKEWLEPLQEVSRWTTAGFLTSRKAAARVAVAEEHYDIARQHLEAVRQIAPDDEETVELLGRLDVLDRFSGFTDRLREGDVRYRRRRQKAALPPDPTLADCFALFTGGDMTGMAETLRLGPVYRYKKAELLAFMLERFADRDFVAEIVRDLNPAEHAALLDVLDAGGVMDWQAFAKAHGDDLDERPYLWAHAATRKTVMGRLRARGLLCEGTAAGQLIIAIPRELRAMLDGMLRERASAA